MFNLHAVEPDDLAALPVQLVLDHEFTCTPQQLFASFERAEDWKVWMDLVVTPGANGPYEVGYRRTAKSGPLVLHEHFTLFERGSQMAFYVERTNHPFMTAFAEHYSVNETAGGCHLQWRIGMAFRFFDVVSGPLIKRALRSGTVRGFPILDRLAQQTEAVRPV